MPHRFSFASTAGLVDDGTAQETGDEGPPTTTAKRQRRPSKLRNLALWWKNGNHTQDGGQQREPCPLPKFPAFEQPPPVGDEYLRTRRSSLPEACPHRRAIPSLPRPQTFRRQESERRERLLEVPPSPTERRAVSADRRRAYSTTACRRALLPPPPVPCPSSSAPDISSSAQQPELTNGDAGSGKEIVSQPSKGRPELPPLQIPQRDDFDDPCVADGEDEDIDLSALQDEYDQRWILNLSMHFRDKSNREKFFVTYAETPYNWRRLTISLDYRNALEGSLEADLSTLHYQRDKSFKIYEAIRESLPEIQYYSTVTNLKLETARGDGQLHVHVREDANEIVRYPGIDLFSHISAPRYRESDVEFIAHLSGFVYKVCVGGRTLIKKEIPGPDTVDEFLYEVNALDALSDSKGVIDLEGLVTDESGQVVKGLLITFASQGALVDTLYDYTHTPDLPFHRREKWAKQIVEGLSDIHEAGFVQGDFTLSNIVIDEQDNALIIDVNRRGCPVGWEPPELSRLIDSGQRIGMCIGVKTDVFQLGMVLWALAEINDEPERMERPLSDLADNIPTYYRDMVASCLSSRPQERPAAKKLLRQFPPNAGRAPSLLGGRSVDFVDETDEMVKWSDHSVSTHRSDKEYIDPSMAITLDDVNAHSHTQRQRHRRRRLLSSGNDEDGGRGGDEGVSPFTSEQVIYFDPAKDETSRDPGSNAASTTYRFESSGSWVVGRRGRSPVSSRRRRSSPFARTAESSSATSLSRSPPSRSRRRCGSEGSLGGVEDVGPEGGVEVLGDAVWDECRKREPSVSQPPADHKGLATLRDEFVAREGGLLHADSGFDEDMVGEVELDGEEGVEGEDRAAQTTSLRDHAEKLDVVDRERVWKGSSRDPSPWKVERQPSPLCVEVATVALPEPSDAAEQDVVAVQQTKGDNDVDAVTACESGADPGSAMSLDGPDGPVGHEVNEIRQT